MTPTPQTILINETRERVSDRLEDRQVLITSMATPIFATFHQAGAIELLKVDLASNRVDYTYIPSQTAQELMTAYVLFRQQVKEQREHETWKRAQQAATQATQEAADNAAWEPPSAEGLPAVFDEPKMGEESGADFTEYPADSPHGDPVRFIR